MQLCQPIAHKQTPNCAVSQTEIRRTRIWCQGASQMIDNMWAITTAARSAGSPHVSQDAIMENLSIPLKVNFNCWDANFSPFCNEISGKKTADLSPISMRSPIKKKKKIGDLTTYPTIVNIHILRGKFSEHFLWKVEKKKIKTSQICDVKLNILIHSP